MSYCFALERSNIVIVIVREMDFTAMEFARIVQASQENPKDINISRETAPHTFKNRKKLV
jgi:hypothetical protein